MHARFVQDFLEHSAARLPDKTALICGSQRWSYAALDAAANHLAHALRRLGVSRGDRVAVFLPNTSEAVISIFAILKAGGTFVTLHPRTKRDKLRSLLHHCRATALIAEARAEIDGLCGGPDANVRSLRAIITCGRGSAPPTPTPQGLHAWNDLFADPNTVAPPPPRTGIDLDLACLIYTSGSTAEPRGVMCDHSNVVFAAQSIIAYLGNVESDIVLNVLPLSFDYGLYQLLMTFAFGGTLVLERSFTFPAAILKTMERERVTGFPGVPTVFALLLRMNLASFDLSRLRYLTNTAAALPPQHLVALRHTFPQATLFSMYGLTETKRTLYLPPAELDRRPGSVGIPIPGTEAWLVDDAGHRLPPGSTGELVVRGRHVMRGYWEDPKSTALRFRPGPLPGERLCFTGDLFRTDDAGFFYFVSRTDEIIKSRGEKVAPQEVETVLYAFPGVVEAAVFGVPDPLLGQAIKAVVVVQGCTVTADQILAHCREHLEDFRVPQYVEFRAELPRTPSGKIHRRGLET